MMKQTITLLLLLSFYALMAQDERGSLGIGFYGALPQNGLKDIGYDNGYGMKLSYHTRKIKLSETMKLQFGMRMDFASMDRQRFNPVQINTPVADLGDLDIYNSMYGFFGLSRLNFGNGRFNPYLEALIGHRNYKTNQYLVAQNPERNPDYEARTEFNKVVFTKRFHYGGSVGFSYKLNRSLYLETSVTYTEGAVGAVMPLKDVVQEDNMMHYNHQSIETDILLINIGLRIQFNRSPKTPSTHSTQPIPQPSNTRYKDKTPEKTTSKPEKNNPSKTSPSSSPVEKKKLEVKPIEIPKEEEKVRS